MDDMPVNVLLLGKGNTVSAEGLRAMAAAGVGGFKLHEDWGSTPAAIDACLRAAEETGVQVAIHTDTLNEAGYVADDARPRSAGARSTRTTRRARAAATRRTSSRSRRSRTCCRARPTRRARTRSTPSTSTSTC